MNGLCFYLRSDIIHGVKKRLCIHLKLDSNIMDIKREFYLGQLIERKHNGLVKIITGLRRVGKSYLLFKLFKKHLVESGVKGSNIIEIALDQEKYQQLQNPIELAAYLRERIKGRGQFYVLIDEIQMSLKVRKPGLKPSDVAPEDRKNLYVTFYDVLNEFMAMPNVDIYVTGSNSKMLSKDIATNFKDRGFEIRVHPLSFVEYVSATGMEKAEAFEEYLIWGGMPTAVLEKSDAMRSKYLKDIFYKVYLSDIRERNKLKDDIVLERVADMLFSSVGSLTSVHNIVNTLKSQASISTTDKTIKKYLDYLEDAFLFSKARRYDIKGKRYLYFPEKYYAEDLGLRNAKVNFRQTEPSHLMENAIYNELVRRGCNVDVGVVEQFGKENGKTVKRQYEIDFVVNRGNDKIYIQSALRMDDAAKERQETLSLRKTGDFFKKVVITDGYGEARSDADGIIRVGVIPFMLDETILKRL